MEEGRMKSRVIVIVCFALIITMVGITSGLAQDATCAAIIKSAFEQLNTGCAGLPGSSACFGSGASAAFLDGSNGTFAQAGDQVPLSALQGVQTQSLNTGSSSWGLALLHVQANVPLALSQQGLKAVLIGDVRLENAVPASDAFTPTAGITVTPLVAANLRAAPSKDATVLASAPVGTELTADGLNSAGDWLRVLNGDQTAWISRQVVASKEGDIGSLPTIDNSTRTLMQSFIMTTGSPAAGCAEEPPAMLVLQAPGAMNALITVNGVDIRFDGTIVLNNSVNNMMMVVVLDGGASAGGVSIPSGFLLNIPLRADNQGMDGNATGLRPINGGERAFLTPIAAGISGAVLHRALTVPTEADVNAMLAQLNGAAGAQVVAGPAAGQADCKRFKPTSPLTGMPLGTTPFYWDGAAGATGYRINLYGSDGAVATSIDTGASTTTYTVDTNAFGGGTNFSWSVEALVNGQVACSSGRVNVVRDLTAQNVSDSGGVPAQPTACSWSGC
jgi:hypothetical protein